MTVNLKNEDDVNWLASLREDEEDDADDEDDEE